MTKRQKNRGVVLLGAITFGVLVATTLRACVVESFVVPSESMTNTLQVSDFFIGEKVSYHFERPNVGDIITFHDPAGSGSILVKRVIATGGETVDLRDGKVYVDDKKIDEPYVDDKPTYPLASSLGEKIEFPYKVPDDELWVMGDNRTDSLDSRYFGSIKLSSVTSRAVCVFWPREHAKDL